MVYLLDLIVGFWVQKHNTTKMEVETLNLDFSQLEMLTDGEPEFMIEILEMILEQSPEVRDQMNQLLANQAYNELGAAAHKYKSSITILGDTSISQLVKDIENYSSREPNLDALPELIRSFEKICDVFLDQIKAELNRIKE